MASHCFSFLGGEVLTRIGATWFVSYAYYERVDSSHLNWKRVSTFRSRISAYRSAEEYHKAWLNEVLVMNPANLSKNAIGLEPQQIKKMAQDILENWQ